ncbi:MAG: exodeoxyribonuclease VII large subunit [Cytophagales bacterium]|nr:exodeoxyribonuclease VII large subunit [Cytophagales bacterium]MDW8384161.1 exodeoxyribonuclease VII large subunit [Flammeovirgaceae bacterium]
MKHYTLLEICQGIKQVFNSFETEFWILAEIAQIDSRNHVYLDLVQKSDNQIVAKMRGIIWENVARYLNQKNHQNLWNILKKGNKVLFLATLHFHEVFGLSLIVQNIDVEYSLGELEQKNQETIALLIKQGLNLQQKKLSLPLVPQRIAVISSANAAGYEDFMQHLSKEHSHYFFEITLYPTLVQGENAVSLLVEQLNRIDETKHDVVVVIRGGGSALDLQVFNEYEVAQAIALCRLPVLTGIGHHRDQTAADLTAYQSFKTPTAVADFLLERLVSFHQTVLQLRQQIEQSAHMLVLKQKYQLQEIKLLVYQVVKSNIEQERHYLIELETKIRYAAEQFLQRQRHKLAMIFNEIQALNPQKVLERGFTLTEVNGKNIKNQIVNKGDILTTHTATQTIQSVVIS